ncbi:MAG: HNH endonuclease [Gammaproteobacteria bacterium]|nr:HNH endonuclease [Gammaproteobacteria bacterium]
MEELTCGVCLKRVKRTGLGQKYCSPRCRNIIKTSVKRGPNYLETLRRDSITCQKCGEENTVIHVHHIDGFGTGHPDNKQNNSLNNLITLCNSCHMQAHRLITRRLWEAHTNEVLDQFAKFMK